MQMRDLLRVNGYFGKSSLGTLLLVKPTHNMESLESQELGPIGLVPTNIKSGKTLLVDLDSDGK